MWQSLPLLTNIVVGESLCYGHEGPITSFTRSPNGTTVATGSSDGTVILWDVQMERILSEWITHPYGAVMALRFSPDGSQLVVCGGSTVLDSAESETVVWDVREQTPAPLGTFRTDSGHSGRTLVWVWTQGGTRLVSSGMDDMALRVWDACTCEQVFVVHDFDHGGFDVLASVDGRWLVPYCSQDGVCPIWTVTPGGCLIPWQHLRRPQAVGSVASGAGTQRIVATAFHPDSKHVATASVDSAVCLWDITTGQMTACIAGPSMGQGAILAFSGASDGMRLLCVPSGSTTIGICAPGGMWCTLKGHTKSVCHASFTADGEHVLSRAADDAVRIWRTSDGLCIGIFKDPGQDSSMGIQGETLFYGLNDGPVIFRRLSDYVQRRRGQPASLEQMAAAYSADLDTFL